MLGNRSLNKLFTCDKAFKAGCIIQMTCVSQQTSQTNWAMAIKPDTHCPGIRAGPVDAVGPGCWMVNSGYRLAVMEASWTAERSERSCSEAAAFCGVHGSFETKPGKCTYDDLHVMWTCSEHREIYSAACGSKFESCSVLTRLDSFFFCLSVFARELQCGAERVLTLSVSGQKIQICMVCTFRLLFLQNN